MLRPDDIYIAIPWSRTDVIEACVDVFLRTPAEIHLGSQAILERFKEARVVQFGPTAGLGLTRPPLTRLQRAEKRAFDLVAATLGLIALAPRFASAGKDRDRSFFGKPVTASTRSLSASSSFAR
jgi:hypothetical protein